MTVKQASGSTADSQMSASIHLSPEKGENPGCWTHIVPLSDLLAAPTILRMTPDSRDVQTPPVVYGSV